MFLGRPHYHHHHHDHFYPRMINFCCSQVRSLPSAMQTPSYQQISGRETGGNVDFVFNETVSYVKRPTTANFFYRVICCRSDNQYSSAKTSQLTSCLNCGYMKYRRMMICFRQEIFKHKHFTCQCQKCEVSVLSHDQICTQFAL